MRLIFLLFLLFAFEITYSQTLSKNYVDIWLTKCDTSIKINKINAYVINGKIFDPLIDTLKLDSALKRIDHDQLLDILYFRSEEVFETTEVPGRIIVVVATKGRQSKKEKKKLLLDAISKYKSNSLVFDHVPKDSKEPVLFINGEEIFFKNCYHELTQIKPGNIYAISINTKPVPWEYYGQNAKNGLVQVWTR